MSIVARLRTRYGLSKLILFGILVISVVFRCGIAIYMGNDMTSLPGITDQLTYNALSQRVLSGYGFSFAEGWWPATQAGEPTAHWSYLYTLYLCLVYRVLGVTPLAARMVQTIVVGITHPLLIYLMGRRVFNSTIGLVSAGLTAVYAYFVYYAAALMTESFYITALLAAIYVTVLLLDPRMEGRGRWGKGLILHLYLGLSLGVAILLRQVSIVLIPVFFITILWVNRDQSRIVYSIINSAVTLILLAMMIAPFTIYNMERFEKVVLLNTNAGFAFFWANHPIHNETFQPILSSETYGELIPRNLKSLDEAALDRALLKQGMQYVLDDPIRYIRLSLSRFPVYFNFWPNPESSLLSNVVRVLSFGILWPFMAYGCFVSLRKPWKDHSFTRAAIMMLLVFIAVYSGIHILSWALIRYRLPVDAVLILFAAVGLDDLYLRVRVRRGIQAPDISLEKGY